VDTVIESITSQKRRYFCNCCMRFESVIAGLVWVPGLSCLLLSLGLQRITITVNTVILGVCRDFWQLPRSCVTAVIIGGLCTKSAQCSFSDAGLALQLTAASTAMAQAEIIL